MAENNHNQDLEIKDNKTNICWIKREIGNIKTQLFNHIPTQIKEIDGKINILGNELRNKIDNIISKLFFGFMIGIAAVIITQIILKFF